MRSSAVGSTFSEYYGVNGNIGRAIMIIASLATVLLGLNKLVQIIGYISPVLLLEQGYEVHITYRRSAGKAEELMAANPGRLFAHKLDQGKIEEIENADFLVENEWYGVIFNAALGSGTVKERRSGRPPEGRQRRGADDRQRPRTPVDLQEDGARAAGQD